MPERTLTVRIIGDDRSLQQAFKRGEKSGKQFQVGVAGIGAAAARSFLPVAAGVVAVREAFEGIGASISAASDLNEQMARSGQIFDEAAGSVEDWSKTTASSFGVSQRAALQFAGTFGLLFRNLGLSAPVAEGFSKQLVELAADLASFNNTDVETALLALRSGLTGEVEPLRKFGVFLSEARSNMQALSDTGKKSTADLTTQEKVLARLNLVMQDTVRAQGDFERTSGQLANQSRILRANIDDLAASLGTNFLPILNAVLPVLNKLIRTEQLVSVTQDAMLETIHESGVSYKASIPALEAYRNGIAKIKGEADQLVVALDAVIARQKELAAAQPPPAALGPSADTQEAGEAARGRASARAARVARENRAAAKRFDEHMKGLGLKLDKAGITAGLDDDLAVLREIERSIQRRIKEEGETFELVEDLTAVRARIASTQAAQAQDSAQAASDAWNDTLDALDLSLEIARATRGFNDDLRALRAIEAAILKQIQAEGRTTELLRQLFQNRQEQAQTLRDQRNAAQFAELGLTPEGERPTPSSAALLRRAQNLLGMKGLDTKTRDQLRRLVAFLKRHLKDAGRDVRAAVLDMLNEISGAFEEGTSGGQLTTFAKRGADDLIRGLGLTPEQERDIRRRFSTFGRRDLAPGAPPGRTVTPSGPRTGRPGPRGDERNVEVNVYIDGQKVEATVTRRQQKKRGRNASSRRGLNPGARR